MDTFQIAALSSSLAILFLFGVFAVFMSRIKKEGTKDTEAFVTARGSATQWTVMWSFYAAAVGAWAIFLPSQYATIAGIVGLTSYAISAGLPIIIVAFFGNMIQTKVPDTTSLCDFVAKRYGNGVRVYVILLSLFNMIVALLAEYTAIGDLFAEFVGVPRWIIVVAVASITSIYTASGGLLVSIITDQGQAILSLVVLGIASVYLACTFLYPLASPLPENLAPNEIGYSSILSMPISMICATMFSEANWQRVWAASDRKALVRGAWSAFALTSAVVFAFGFFGFLGNWAQLEPLDPNNNLAFFVPFASAGGKGLIHLCLIVLACTMNQSASDSLQNAIISTISTTFLLNKPVNYTRLCIVLVNTPIVIMALQGWSLLDVFFAANILTTTAAVPVLSGVWISKDEGVTQASVLGSCFAGVASVLAASYGILALGMGYDTEHQVTTTLRNVIEYSFTATMNNYDYRLFVAAIVGSSITLSIWVFVKRWKNRDLNTTECKWCAQNDGIECVVKK